MLSFSGACFRSSGRTAAVGRLELDRAEIALTVAVEVLVFVHLEVTVVSGVLVASAIEAGVVEVLAMVPAAIALVVMGLGIVEMVVVGIVQVYAEQPTSGIDVHGAEEVVQPHEKAVLAATQHPAQVIVAQVEAFIVAVECPSVSVHHIVHQMADTINEVEVDFIHIVVLMGVES